MVSAKGSFMRNRRRHVFLWVLAILVLSFAGTDYYLRGQLYFTKRVANFLYLHTWQAVFPPSGPVKLYVRIDADQKYRLLHPGWESHLPAVFDAVARRFAEEFNIRLTLLSVGAWVRPDGLDDYTDILKYAARKMDRHGTDISIIMTVDDAARAQDGRWVDAGVAHELGQEGEHLACRPVSCGGNHLGL